MGLWYRLAPVAFLGGTVAAMGGHNPYEPAALDTALIHGPSTHAFAEAFEALSGVAWPAADPSSAARALSEALSEAGRTQEGDRRAAAAGAALAAQDGAADETAAAALAALTPAPL